MFLDSAGIHALVLCHADAAQLGCRLTVVDPHPVALQVLTITGLLSQFGLTGQAVPASTPRAAGHEDAG